MLYHEEMYPQKGRLVCAKDISFLEPLADSTFRKIFYIVHLKNILQMSCYGDLEILLL